MRLTRSGFNGLLEELSGARVQQFRQRIGTPYSTFKRQ
jgi:hypothetical protein